MEEENFYQWLVFGKVVFYGLQRDLQIPLQSFSQRRSQHHSQQYFDEIGRNIRNHAGPQGLGEGKAGLYGQPCRAEQIVNQRTQNEAKEQNDSVIGFFEEQAADDRHEDKTDEVSAGGAQSFSEAGAKG